ncbi:4-hydroxyphenylpyruvate dioxygenase, partial [Aetokthonos hydrillicola]
FVLSSPLLPISPVAKFLHQHPPGVVDIAFCVEDVEAAIATAKAHNAKVLQSTQQHQQSAALKWAKISAWGGLTHTLIQRGGEKEVFSPSSFITAIDHVVLNVASGDLERAVAWYENVLDFQRQQTFKIQTDYSGLYSQVIVSRNGCVQLPINEPASANSQIQEFLDVNNGPGIQHIALQTRNIVDAIAQFRACGLSFLSVPASYYSRLVQREGFPLSEQDIRAISQQEILVDWDEKSADALLLQIFTQPVFGYPTFFFEFIERRFQAKGFGEGNFRALFEAMEQEQLKRGSLQDFSS